MVPGAGKRPGSWGTSGERESGFPHERKQNERKKGREQKAVHREGGPGGRHSEAEAQRYFEAFENAFASALKGDKKVQIVGFGELCAREQKAREGRNPRTGEKARIAASRTPAFGADNVLKESI